VIVARSELILLKPAKGFLAFISLYLIGKRWGEMFEPKRNKRTCAFVLLAVQFCKVCAVYIYLRLIVMQCINPYHVSHTFLSCCSHVAFYDLFKISFWTKTYSRDCLITIKSSVSLILLFVKERSLSSRISYRLIQVTST